MQLLATGFLKLMFSVLNGHFEIIFNFIYFLCHVKRYGTVHANKWNIIIKSYSRRYSKSVLK
jgi:hypothetical protein